MFFCWGTLLIVVSVAVGGVCVLYKINSHIRNYVLLEFEKRYPELDIDIGKVVLTEQKGISIRHLECSIPGQPGRPKRPLVIVDELFLECPVTIHALFRKEVPIRKIVLRNPIVRLTRTRTGLFDELKLLQFSSSENSMQPVPVEIYNGILLYEDQTCPPHTPIKVTGISMTLTPPEVDKKPEVLTDLEKPATPPEAWHVVGSARGDLFRQLAFEGFYEPENRQWSATVGCRHFDWIPEYLVLFPLKKPIAGNPEYQRSLESFQGRFDFELSAKSDSTAPQGFRYALDGSLIQGRAELYEVDRTLSEVNARFHLNENGLNVEKMTGIAEAARFNVSYSQDGWNEQRRALLTANIRGLGFDNKFVESLSPFLNENTRTLLNRFAYSGITDLDAKVDFQNGAWKPQSLSLNFAELNFSFLEFPYKVDRLAGDLRVDSTAKLVFQLQTRKEEPMRVRILGEYANVFVDPAGYVKIWGEEVPIDEKLFGAIPSEERELIRSLHPTGKINAYLFIGLPPNDQPLEKQFQIGLDRITAMYDKFPYPLRDICGELRLDNDTWTFQNIVGTNESAQIKCRGYLKPVVVQKSDVSSTERTTEFLMEIHADELPLDGQLAEALTDAGQRELLTSLRARGKVDLDAQIRYVANRQGLDLWFRATPRPGLSICPARFPYRIDDLEGEFVYKDGEIFAQELKGRNRDTRLGTGIACRFSPDGRWTMRLDSLRIDQLPPNRELQDALPTNLQTIYGSLQIRKPINLRGVVEFFKEGTESPLCTAWDIGVLFHQNSAQLGHPVENVFGELRLSGYAENEDFRFAGELNLDSATVKGFQVTDLRGPFFYDGRSNQLHVGQRARLVLPPLPDVPALRTVRQSPWFTGFPQPRPITGRMFDGTLYSEGLVVLENILSYSINTSLIGADLAKISHEIEPGGKKITGTLDFQSHFKGDGRKIETLGGHGSIRLRNANIYDAPGMLRLLRELSIREVDPNAGAFSSADIDFRLQGYRMFFDPIVFEGGAFSLTGNGEMRLDTRNVNMIMKTRLGNRRTQIPIFSDILGGAGDQIVQLSVQGPISDPTVSRIALPEIQKAIRHIQGEDHVDYEEYAAPESNATPTPSRTSPWRNITPWK